MAETDHARLTVGVLCFGGLTASLTQTLVIPIQSELPRLLDTSPANAAWVVTITLLAGAVAMPIAGRLADLFGKQRVVSICAAILVVGSLVCALSDSLAPMLAGRALQGASMGFIPVAISLMREVTPPHSPAPRSPSMSATLGVGGAIGLPLSAWIVDSFDWHVLFWVATGLAATVLALTWFVVPHVQDARRGGSTYLAPWGLPRGSSLFLVGVSKATAWGWTDARTLGCIAVGILVLLGWGAFELRQAEPLVDLRTTANRPVLFTNLAAVAVGFGMMAQAVVIPQLLELPEATGHGLGQSLLATGLWMAPSGLMMLAFAPISGRLIASTGARRTLILGATVLAAGYVVGLVLMDAPWQLLVAACVASAGVGIGYAAMPTLILDAVPAHEAASAVGLNALMRSVGTTLAAAAMGTILTSNTTPFGDVVVPSAGAFQACFAVGAAAALLGALITLLVPRRELETHDQPPIAVPVGASR